MSTKPNIPEEEIDLGNLFSQIGKMFSNFFAFIGNILSSIYHYGIIFLLFIRKNIIILGLATLIGVIVGFILDLTKDELYTSEMSVETAYGSGNRLYSQIDYLNNLISEEDSTKIGNIFGVSSTEAARLSQFFVEPSDAEKNMFMDYDNYLQNTDTIYTYHREFTYEDFLMRKTDEDIRFQKIIVKAQNPNIFIKLNDSIKSLVENVYFKGLKTKKIEELQFEKENLKKDLSQIDSLRKRYKETAYMQFEEKDHENSGVSFRTINAGYRGNVDKDLYDVSDTLLLKLRDVNKMLVENEDILKIRSEFTIGEIKLGLLSRSWVRLGLLCFFITFLVLAGIQFNRYLNNYERKLLE